MRRNLEPANGGGVRAGFSRPGKAGPHTMPLPEPGDSAEGHLCARPVISAHLGERGREGGIENALDEK